MLGLLKNKYKIRKLIKKISQVKIWLFFMKKSNLFSYLFIYYDRLLFNNTNNKDYRRNINIKFFNFL